MSYDWRTKSKITKGFHNWIQLVSEKEAGRLIYYHPPIRKFVNNQVSPSCKLLLGVSGFTCTNQVVQHWKNLF